MLLQITTGEENFINAGTIKIKAMYRGSPSGEDAPLFSSIKDSKSGIKQVSHNFVHASSENVNNGKWVDGVYDCKKNHAIVTLIVERKKTTGFGYNKVCLSLLVDNNGPLSEVAVRLSGARQSTRSIVYIEGRFRVLTPEQLKEFNITYEYHRPDDFDFEYHDGMITLRELESAVKPLVPATTKEETTESGKVVKVVLHPQRRIVLNRKKD